MEEYYSFIQWGYPAIFTFIIYTVVIFLNPIFTLKRFSVFQQFRKYSFVSALLIWIFG